MSEDLEHEFEAINSIYGDDTLSKSSEQGIYVLSLPSHSVSIRISFPPTYPHKLPGIAGVQSTGTDTRKGFGTHVLEIAEQVLWDVYTPDSVCLFDLIQELEARLITCYYKEKKEAAAAEEEEEEEETKEKKKKKKKKLSPPDHFLEPEGHQARKHPLHDLQPVQDGPNPLPAPSYVPHWHLSQTVTEKKSAFLARACHVQCPATVRYAMSHLLGTDKKVRKATHNITAYRVRDLGLTGVTYQDCDDDGEAAAGGRLLHLLQVMDVWDVLVVVSRWYGGVKLGPDRFRLINQVGREAVMEGEWMKRGKDRVTDGS